MRRTRRTHMTHMTTGTTRNGTMTIRKACTADSSAIAEITAEGLGYRCAPERIARNLTALSMPAKNCLFPPQNLRLNPQRQFMRYCLIFSEPNASFPDAPPVQRMNPVSSVTVTMHMIEENLRRFLQGILGALCYNEIRHREMPGQHSRCTVHFRP